MKEQSEIDTAQIVKDFFLGEFSFDELKYDPENLPKGSRKELADVVVDYGNNVIAFQIKGRGNFDNGTSEDEWVKKYTDRAKNQLVDTYNQFQNNVVPPFVNGRGDRYELKKHGIYTGIIILYNERVQEYKKVLNCRRLNGIVHCFTYKDFKNCCEKLVLPKDIMEYIAYREKYVEMDRICKEEESDLVDRFLIEKYGTNNFDPDELYIFRWFLNNYKDKLENGNRKQYREIIEVFLELDRAGVDAFSRRLGKIISLAKKSINSDNSYIVPGNRELSSFLFLSADSGSKIIEYVEKMTYLFMYKTKSHKCLTVVAYFDEVETFRLDWVFIELPWEYDEKLDEMCNLPEFKKLWNPQLILTGKIENY